MSVILPKNRIRHYASALAFIFMWMSGVASMSHAVDCDDDLVVQSVKHQISRPTVPGSPDICAACAWNAAGNVFLPTALVAPAEVSFRFAPQFIRSICPGNKTLRITVSRGPPSTL